MHQDCTILPFEKPRLKQRIKRGTPTLGVTRPLHLIEHVVGNEPVGETLSAVRPQPEPEKHGVAAGHSHGSDELRMLENLVIKLKLAHGWPLPSFDSDDDIGPILSPVAISGRGSSSSASSSM